jgi:hypothetical protein
MEKDPASTFLALEKASDEWSLDSKESWPCGSFLHVENTFVERSETILFYFFCDVCWASSFCGSGQGLLWKRAGWGNATLSLCRSARTIVLSVDSFG